MVKGDVDLESWDARKFGELSLKSNPQIVEWLRSLIVYIDSEVGEKLREFFNRGCSLEYLRQHYIRMAFQNYNKYMSSGKAHSCKKYLYVLRGIACSRYIQSEKKLPPLSYKKVIGFLPEKPRVFFEECIIRKNKSEKAQIDCSGNISNFIEKSLS